MTITNILRRCCESPERHLAEPTFAQFQAYSLGYGFCEAEDFDNTAFTAAVKEDYGVRDSWPLNLATTGFLVAAEGAELALAKYLDYRERFAKPTNKPYEFDARFDLLEILSAEDSIRKRPAMYFGNDPGASHIWSMISGCRWAEFDESGQPGRVAAFQADFQRWLEERFPFSKGLPWHRTLHFVSLGSSGQSLRVFFECFDLFRAGEPPDSPSGAAKTIMESIAERYGCDPSDMADDIKRIAPI